MTGTPRLSQSFLGGAISTAASPLVTTFGDISCRSPVTPRRPTRHDAEGDVRQPRRLLVNTDASRCRPYETATRLSTPTFLAIATHRMPSPDTPKQSGDTDIIASPAQQLLCHPLTPSILLTPSPPSADLDATKLGVFSAINIILGKTVGVGIYSVPSSIFSGVGSVGMSILVWVLGSAISFCGLAVYLDLGSALPRSGGERIYLERIFRKPRMLATCMFMAYVVLLGFSTPNCIVLGEYAVYAMGGTAGRWNVRMIAVGVITLSCVMHTRLPKLGLQTINVLGVGKMVILLVVILSGMASLIMGMGRSREGAGDHSSGGSMHLPYTLTTAQRNFSNIWAGSSTQPYDYATALLKVLYCFRGYSTANQVLSEVRNPVRTLRIAAPVALSLVSASYILANIAYFLAVEREDFRNSGAVVAGHFFRNIFGDIIGERVLPCFIIISAFGNIAATSFAQARVNQELGKDGLLPFSNFWKSSSQWNTPAAGLFLHWIVSVLVIIVPPPGEIYNFLVDIGGYPVSAISVSISAGLLYLQHSPSEGWQSPFRAKKIYIIVFLLSNCLLLTLPWIRPLDGKGDSHFPYYAYPATALAILALGAVYWILWAKLKPLVVGSFGRESSRTLEHSYKRNGLYIIIMDRLKSYVDNTPISEQMHRLLNEQDSPLDEDSI